MYKTYEYFSDIYNFVKSNGDIFPTKDKTKKVYEYAGVWAIETPTENFLIQLKCGRLWMTEKDELLYFSVGGIWTLKMLHDIIFNNFIDYNVWSLKDLRLEMRLRKLKIKKGQKSKIRLCQKLVEDDILMEMLKTYEFDK